MKKKLFIFIFLTIFFMGCGNTEKSQRYSGLQLNYESPFSPKKIPEVEIAVRKVAAKWNLKVLKKDSWIVREISDGGNAFGIFLSAKEKTFTVFIGNIGVTNILVMGISEDKEVQLSRGQLEILSNELLLSLKEIKIDMILKSNSLRSNGSDTVLEIK